MTTIYNKQLNTDQTVHYPTIETAKADNNEISEIGQKFLASIEKAYKKAVKEDSIRDDYTFHVIAASIGLGGAAIITTIAAVSLFILAISIGTTVGIASMCAIASIVCLMGGAGLGIAAIGVPVSEFGFTQKSVLLASIKKV